MKKILLNGSICLTILVAALSTTPLHSVQAYDEISGTQVWTTPRTINSDIVIMDDGNLTIQTTLTFNCIDLGEPNVNGMSEEKIDIIVLPGGTLMIESALLQGYSTGSCWQGIFYQGGSLGYIRNSEIRDATTAVLIVDTTVEVTGNHIHSLYAPDKTSEDPYHSDIDGIRINYHEDEVEPSLISGNTIENVFAGSGWSDPTGWDFSMGGASAHGITIANYTTGSRSSEISGNIIRNIKGGDGGDGLTGPVGADGSAGTEDVAPGNGDWGGDGAISGMGGDACGLYIYRSSPTVTDNQIQGVTGGAGGQGGAGGAGGRGGHAFNLSTLPSGTSARDGDPGGSGGEGGIGGNGASGGVAYGIRVLYQSGFGPASPILLQNTIQLVQGGRGGDGGQAGPGGGGGNGGGGLPVSVSPASNGGAGGNAGGGGIGGRGGSGGEAYGVGINGGTPAIFDGNRILDVLSGEGGNGGSGINGATGGIGGAGGDNSDGTGGAGGQGGAGGMAGAGGNGSSSGWTSGVFMYNSSNSIILANNIIARVENSAPGTGGDGATGGSGGTGGDGGNMAGDNQGAGGNGGSGAMGSTGGSGGSGLEANLVEVNEYTLTLVNNTLIDPIAPETGGAAGSPGTGGTGGTGGAGDPTGDQGGDDTTTIDPAYPGDEGYAFGLFIYSSTTVDVSNSILMNTAGASNSYGIYASAGSTFTNDYNDVFNWGTPYLGDASDGAHDINLDPLFINQLTDDFRLTGISPCKDNGNNGAPAIPDHDLDGHPRPVGIVDMGAYEISIPFFIPFILSH